MKRTLLFQGRSLFKLIKLALLVAVCTGSAYAACSNTSYGNGATCVQLKECETLSSVTSLACTFTNSVTSGSLLIAICRLGTSQAISSVSDNINAGNYTKAWEQDDSGTSKSLGLFYLPNSSSGSITVTCIWGGGAGTDAVDIIEVSGIVTSSPLDQQTSTTYTATSSPSSGNITTTNANDVIWGVLASTNGTTITISSENGSFTQEMNDTFGTANHSHVHAADKGVSSTQTVSYSPTLSATAGGQIGIVAFKAAGGVATPKTFPQVVKGNSRKATPNVPTFDVYVIKRENEEIYTIIPARCK